MCTDRKGIKLERERYETKMFLTYLAQTDVMHRSRKPVLTDANQIGSSQPCNVLALQF